VEPRSEEAEKAVRDIRRAIRRRYSAEEKVPIMIAGLRGEESVFELSRFAEADADTYSFTRLAEWPEASEQTIMRLAGNVSRSMLAGDSDIRSQAKQAAISALEDAAGRASSETESPQNPPQSEHEERTVVN
jgi:transposase